MDQAKLKDLRDRVLAGGPTNAWRLSECLALLDALQEPRLARNPSTTDFDNTILRNAGVALMQSTDAFNFVEGMTLAQIGQALYDFAAMREKYPALRDAKEAFEDHLRRSEWIQKDEHKLFYSMVGYHRDDAARIVVERLLAENKQLKTGLPEGTVLVSRQLLEDCEEAVGNANKLGPCGLGLLCQIQDALRTSAQDHNGEESNNVG